LGKAGMVPGRIEALRKKVGSAHNFVTFGRNLDRNTDEGAGNEQRKRRLQLPSGETLGNRRPQNCRDPDSRR